MLRFSERLPSVPFDCPSICAKCGERQGKHPWVVRSNYERLFLFVYNSHKVISFQVPVCDECKTKLERLQKGWYVAFMVSGFSVLASLCLLILFPENYLVWLGLFVLALLGAFVTMWIRGFYAQGKDIGSYNGKCFKFKNERFERQFAVLNPDLSRR